VVGVEFLPREGALLGETGRRLGMHRHVDGVDIFNTGLLHVICKTAVRACTRSINLMLFTRGQQRCGLWLPDYCSNLLLYLGRIAALAQDAAYCFRRSVVCVCVSTGCPSETAEPTEMPFGLCTQVSPRKHELGWGPNPHGTRNFGSYLGMSINLPAVDIFNRIRQGATSSRHVDVHNIKW